MNSDVRERTLVSVFVVSFNTLALTRRCLASIREKTGDVDLEIIAVDNASRDGSAEMIAREFPEVRLIASPVNLGFGAANNLAARGARGDWFLLINPDAAVMDRAIDRLLAFAESHSGAGILGGRTLNDDLSLNPWSCRRRPTPWSLFCHGSGLSRLFRFNALLDPDSLGGWQRDTVRHVDVVSGCFFMVQRALWERLGGFDPDFFMYGEETDFCLRARALGHRPLITPEAEVIHHGGASETVRADKMVRLFAAHVTLFRKHWSRGARSFGAGMLWLWAATRTCGGWLLGHAGSESGRRKAREWGEVLKRRREWFYGYPAAGSDSS